MDIDKTSKIPIYYQLKQLIMDKINKGEWNSDSPIPSERELSEAYKISRMTIRQAVNELVNEGLIYRERGKGTFIRPPKIEQSDVMSFSEAALNSGYKAETDVNTFEIVNADDFVSEKLGISGKKPVYYIQRMRMIKNKIIGIESMYLPVEYAHKLHKSDFTASVYELLNKNYGYTIDHVQTTMQAIVPGKDELELFKVSDNIPVLKVTAVHITSENLKLYYEQSFYRSDMFILNLNIYKR